MPRKRNSTIRRSRRKRLQSKKNTRRTHKKLRGGMNDREWLEFIKSLENNGQKPTFNFGGIIKYANGNKYMLEIDLGNKYYQSIEFPADCNITISPPKLTNTEWNRSFSSY
jgi:hypothetical protein